MKKLVLLTGFMVLLGSISVFGSHKWQSGVSAALAAEKPAPISGTEEYINGWTHPEATVKDKTPDTIMVKGDRQRMIADDTDEYVRGWNLPDEVETGVKKTETRSQSHPAKALPVNDTEDYINGWSSEQIK